MDRTKANLVLNDIRTTLQSIAAKHGLTLTPKGGRFGASMVRMQVEMLEQGAVADLVQQAAPNVAIGTEFPFQGRTYKVTGFRKGRDFVWVIAARQPDGKLFRLRPSDITI